MHLALPILFMTICVTLVLLPNFKEPTNLLIGIAITLAGIPFYFVCIAWKDKPKVYGRLSNAMVELCRGIFNTTIIEANEAIQ